MIDSIINFLKKIKDRQKKDTKSKETAKERLHLVLMQDRANVSADFLELMKQEIIEVIKKYIEVDESEIDVRLTNKENSDGTIGTPALYANIPISNVREIKVDNRGKNENKKETETIEEKAETETETLKKVKEVKAGDEKEENIEVKENNKEEAVIEKKVDVENEK